MDCSYCAEIVYILYNRLLFYTVDFNCTEFMYKLFYSMDCIYCTEIIYLCKSHIQCSEDLDVCKATVV